ncbi:hypothetical protein [Leptotrichia wadei]|uniref:hypothetical protein n=1 Tax=Leptotrichia wadei TaxID=157687 RepID=UPI0028D24A4D|nr:hypothetical protein [Leptotrichia wadei]
MKKLLVILILAVGAISFSALAQNIKKSRDNKSVNENVVQNLSFDTITLKLVGQRLSKDDENKIELEYENFKGIGKNKKVYTEKDFQVNGKKPKIMISKIVSTKMIRNFIESDEEIQIIGFLDETNERDKGIRYKPFDVKFTENQDWVKKIYFKDGVIYIWDN